MRLASRVRERFHPGGNVARDKIESGGTLVRFPQSIVLVCFRGCSPAIFGGGGPLELARGQNLELGEHPTEASAEGERRHRRPRRPDRRNELHDQPLLLGQVVRDRG